MLNMLSIYTRFKRKASRTFLYESHEPLALCYDTSLDTTKISDEELQTYNDLNKPIDIHNIYNISLSQSIILYDTLSVDYVHRTIYTSLARSKDYTFNAECKLNEKKIRKNKNHKSIMNGDVFSPD